MSPVPGTDLPIWSSFPRVSGDEPTDAPHADATSPFSPRERG